MTSKKTSVLLASASSYADVRVQAARYWCCKPEDIAREPIGCGVIKGGQFMGGFYIFEKDGSWRLQFEGVPHESGLIARYVAPENVYRDWVRLECSDYAPTERQLIVIEAVQSALDCGLFYTSDVLEYCKAYLGVTPEQAGLQQSDRMRVEGGDFGMDCYYAGRYIDAKNKHAVERLAADKLKPRVGLELGTIMFNDFKRITGVKITAICGESGLELTGKRGASAVILKCSVKQIENAINRAFEKKLRKDDFNAFVATKNSATALRPVLTENKDKATLSLF